MEYLLFVTIIGVLVTFTLYIEFPEILIRSKKEFEISQVKLKDSNSFSKSTICEFFGWWKVPIYLDRSTFKIFYRS